MTDKLDIGSRFGRAVRTLHASPLEKMFLVGPGRFVVRQWARWANLKMEREAALFFGESMTVVLPEIISEQIYSYGFFDEIVTGLALRAVRPGDVVIDVGAHFGYFTLLFAHLVGEAGRVVSIEPTPSTFAVLRRNTAMLKHVTPLNKAAGRQSGRLAISDFGLTHCAWNTLSSSSRMPAVLGKPLARVDVEVIKLDEWFRHEGIRPDVIKIDAENFEAEVVAGLTETLQEARPRILMETASQQAVQAGIALMDLDYRMFTSERPGILTPQEGNVADVVIKNKDVLFVPAPQVDQIMGSV